MIRSLLPLIKNIYFSLYCRVTEDGEVFVLEVQSFCSFGPISLLPKLAARQGISPEELYSSLLENAVKRGAQ